MGIILQGLREVYLGWLAHDSNSCSAKSVWPALLMIFALSMLSIYSVYAQMERGIHQEVASYLKNHRSELAMPVFSQKQNI